MKKGKNQKSNKLGRPAFKVTRDMLRAIVADKSVKQSKNQQDALANAAKLANKSLKNKKVPSNLWMRNVLNEYKMLDKLPQAPRGRKPGTKVAKKSAKPVAKKAVKPAAKKVVKVKVQKITKPENVITVPEAAKVIA